MVQSQRFGLIKTAEVLELVLKKADLMLVRLLARERLIVQQSTSEVTEVVR